MEEDDDAERQQAELEFLASAYESDEAWSEEQQVSTVSGKASKILIHRRIFLTTASDQDDDAGKQNGTVPVRLTMTMVEGYPSREPLQVSIQLEDGEKTLASFLKLVYDELMPALLTHCRASAKEALGQEGLFLVLAAADEWVQDEWPKIVQNWQQQQEKEASSTKRSAKKDQTSDDENIVLGRRLIFSHHIISSQKRKDMQSLAKHYQLTGFVRVGWPGLIVIEGLEQHCLAFYDDIRQWQWQYLVVRGEMSESIHKTTTAQQQAGHTDVLQGHRRFQEFREVEEMSIVGNACREAGLENLFKTAMKIYDNTTEENMAAAEKDAANKDSDSNKTNQYGVLMLVDHMNDGNKYRKWLRKNASETNLQIWIRHLNLRQQQQDSSNNPATINQRGPFVVALLGSDKASTSLFLKRWRSSRVDVDSKGKPCLERKMKVLAEGLVEPPQSSDDGTTTDTNKAPMGRMRLTDLDEGEAQVFGASANQVAELLALIDESWGSALENS